MKGLPWLSSRSSWNCGIRASVAAAGGSEAIFVG